MTTISATHVLTTVSPSGPPVKISTLLLRYPRFIHAEFMTHRVFSRNAASSRAIPVPKLIQDVVDNYLEPLWWGKNQSGMQAFEELTGNELRKAREAWRIARLWAIKQARLMHKAGAHKQIVNRILEPYAHITVVVTATEWTNFFGLRCHSAAEPHIHMLALEMKAALDKATPQLAVWHLPFVNQVELNELTLPQVQMLSVARCASTSYKTVEGFDMTLDRAADIYHKLTASDPMHASPLEHVAIADEWSSHAGWKVPQQHRNFVGWRQYRAMLEHQQYVEKFFPR